MSVKETLIKVIMEQGFDGITACDIASETIADLKTKPSGTYKFIICGVEISINKR